MKNKFKLGKIGIFLLLLILLFPLPGRLKDGGSIRFKSLLYSVTKVQRLNNLTDGGMYLEGYEVEILNMKVYSNVK